MVPIRLMNAAKAPEALRPFGSTPPFTNAACVCVCVEREMDGDDGDGHGEEEGVEGGEQRSAKDVTGTALRWPTLHAGALIASERFLSDTTVWESDVHRQQGEYASDGVLVVWESDVHRLWQQGEYASESVSCDCCH
jgi:hypothetical protein